MSGPRRVLGLVALATLSVGILTACADDDTAAPAAEESSSTTDGTTTSSTSTSTVPDAPAQEPPTDQSAEGEGLGDTLAYVADLARVDEDGRAADPEGRLEIRPQGDETICVDVEISGFDGGIEVVHVRRATDDADPVVTLGPPATSTGADHRWLDHCVSVPSEVAGALATDPGAFTVDVGVDGQIEPLRGQLHPATIFDLELS